MAAITNKITLTSESMFACKYFPGTAPEIICVMCCDGITMNVHNIKIYKHTNINIHSGLYYYKVKQ